MGFKQIFKKQYQSILDHVGLMILMFIGPIFLTVVFGGVYVNDYINDIPIGILDEDYSPLSRMVEENFAQDARFNIVSYPSSKEELQRQIDSGKIQMGLYIPPDFEKNVTSLKSSEILAILDGSNNVVAGNAYAQATSIIQTLNAGVEMKLIQAKGVMPYEAKNMALTYQVGERVLYDPKMTYMNYLMICFLAVFIQQLFLSSMSSMLIRNHAYLSKDDVAQNILATVSAIIAGLAPSTIVSFLFLKYVYKVNMIGSSLVFWMLTIMFLFAISGPAMVMASLTKDRVKFAQISFMLSVPVFISSGIVWPLDQMPWSLVLIIRCLWPMASYAKIGQEVLVKGRSFYSIMPDIIWMVAYGIIWFIIGVILYKKAFNEGNESTALLQ